MTQPNRPWTLIILAALITIWLISSIVFQQTTHTQKLTSQKPDFSAFNDVKAKKSAFFNYLLPATQIKNAKILEQRDRLLAILAKPADRQKRSDKRFLAKLAEQYNVTEPDEESGQLTDEQIATLKRRVDIVPPSMALAQAASESGWGTSRFARLGNNFFGEWCYTKGCGLLPARRPDGAIHEVRKFDSVNDSIAAYYDNINTGRAYLDLRLIREQLRKNNQAITGLALTPGLIQYSERREAYVEDIQQLIRSNKLSVYDRNTNETNTQ